MDENTAKEIAKENMWKTLQKMVTESDMKSLSTEDQIFTRKLKIFRNISLSIRTNSDFGFHNFL